MVLPFHRYSFTFAPNILLDFYRGNEYIDDLQPYIIICSTTIYEYIDDLQFVF